MEIVTYEWCKKHLKNSLHGDCPKAYCVISDKVEVNYGNLNDCDLNYCYKHNIPVYNFCRCGGTIVTSDGTIAVGLLTDVKNDWQNKKFLKSFADFLKNKGIEVKIDHNDILINDYKVASASEWKLSSDKNRIYGVYLISHDVNLDAIQNICKKEMKKTPKGLKEFGIDKAELIEWVKSYFNKIEENVE